MKAWKKRAIALITTVANGPIIIAARGVPTGCEDEPVTGTGMCHTEITKTTAPSREIRGRYDGSFLMRLSIILSPRAMNIPDITNQNKIHCGSRIPSEI
jgi:hypothetical protein